MESGKFEDMRRSMVDSQLRTSGVTESWVLTAMGSIAREDYVPVSHQMTAYMDRSLDLENGEMLNPPVSTALLLQAADVRADDNVLLIGQANGYVAAILKTRTAHVTTTAADNLGSASAHAPFSRGGGGAARHGAAPHAGVEHSRLVKAPDGDFRPIHRSDSCHHGSVVQERAHEQGGSARHED